MLIPNAKARSTRYLLVTVLFLLGLCSQRASAADPGQAAKIASAAGAFVGLLDDEQRQDVQYDLDDADQRVRWSNLPVSMAEHGGLRMGDLNAEQRAAVMTLLRTALSEWGYEKVVGIVESDEVLKNNSDSGAPAFGRDEYFVSFMGKPSATSPWMIQFGGHHLALNITLAGERGVLTPSLIAVQPAKFEWNGKTVRPMGRETDKALELLQSLNAAQREEAVLGFQMRDLVLGPGHDGETIQPEGVKASTFSDTQKALLLELISEWSGIIHESAAAEKMAEVKSHLDETWFAWAGPIEPGKAYFRVQGPTIVIEYAPQRLGGDVTMHLHSMFRDPTNDYGRKFTAE